MLLQWVNLPVRNTYFKALESKLRDAGIRPAVSRDIAAELADHLDDVAQELVADGHPESTAISMAFERLGTPETIAAAASEHRRLSCWWRRYPHAALVAYPLAYAAALPAVSVLAGLRHAPVVGRWLSCLLAGGIVTATIFLALTTAIGL